VCDSATLGGGGYTLINGASTVGGGSSTLGSVAWSGATSVGGTLGNVVILVCGGGIGAGPSFDIMLVLFGRAGVE
jgi:hypothetical protein